MVFIFVIVLVVKGLAGGEHHVEDFIDALIEKLLGYHAVAHGLCDIAVGVAAGIRHFEVIAGNERLDPVVVAAPVGDDHAVIAPLAVEDVLKKVGVLVGVLAVQAVVRGHDAFDPALLDRHLERRQVNFPQRALVDDRIVGHAPQLLRVCGKVLDAGRDTV